MSWKNKLNNLEKLKKEIIEEEKIIKLEEEYQKLCSRFSLSYLSGSPWYVGPSYRKYLENKKKFSSQDFFIFFMLDKINQNKSK